MARCEAQMRGYWADEALTKTRLIDGWVHTGDIGKLDANGFLYVLDRSDDMIVSGGYNIWPAELETVIADHPDVVEVAVFAIPDPRWGETPMAVVCVTESARLSEAGDHRTVRPAARVVQEAVPGGLHHRTAPQERGRQTPTQNTPGTTLARTRPPSRRRMNHQCSPLEVFQVLLPTQIVAWCWP